MATKSTPKKQPAPKRERPFYRHKWFLWPVETLIALIIIVLLAFWLSPWPGALVIRYEFNKNGLDLTHEMERHEPKSGVVMMKDIQYRSGDADAKLDAYLPQSVRGTGKRLPVIIWTHGGAWLSGDKNNDVPYFKLLAQKGYAVIAPNYSLAPGHTYPTPVHQLNDVYAYVGNHAETLQADMNKVVLAGDSAGAQLSAQMAAIITNPSYAKEVGVVPSLKPAQLKGVVLNCGIYMMERLAEPTKDLSKLIAWGDDVTVWGYSGTHDYADPVIRQMSPYYHVTGDFPPTYISGGNADPLTDTQSKPLADKLQVLGVSVDRLFYAQNHTPALSHEYQFQLDKKDARDALQATLSFIEKQTK
jgi:acetyl esterase